MKFLLTTGATTVLLLHIPTVTRMARVAADMVLSASDFRALRIQLVTHAAGGLLVLLAATVLSVYKPWGMTQYGLRKQHEPRRVTSAELSSRAESEIGVGTSSIRPRWVYVVGIHAVGLALLLLVVHLTGGGLQSH